MEAYSPSENPKKINVISISAFMFSVLIYVSVFYFCSISPLILLHTTKFWFFLSNNLVLIIAIDYSTFSASKQDLYQESIVHGRTRSVFISPLVKQDQEYFIRERTSKTEVVSVVQVKEESNDESGENLEFETCNMIENCVTNDIQVVDLGRIEVEETEKDVMSEREDNASNSEKEKEQEETSVENEFSTLTDEELNRRVEEFIQRFNNEIRLQALRNLHQI